MASRHWVKPGADRTACVIHKAGTVATPPSHRWQTIDCEPCRRAARHWWTGSPWPRTETVVRQDVASNAHQAPAEQAEGSTD